MGDQRGQTAAEYLGMLVVIAAVIGSLATADVGATVKRHVDRAICTIASAGDCGGAAPEDTPTATVADDGPPLAGAPTDIPVLPFPGSASVTSPSDDSPVKGGFRFKGSASRSDDHVNADGCPTTSISASGAIEAYGNVAVKGKGAGAGADVYAGKASDYTVTTTPDRADEYDDGAELPNPLDPRTLQPGEAIELSERSYDGYGLSAQYRALQASLGFEEGRKASSGVQRVDASTVRIYAGDSEYVRNALAAGVSLGGAGISAGTSQQTETGSLTAIDVDVSTPAGWRTYQRFAATGQLPAEGAPGTSDPTSSETLSITQTTGITGTLGSASATWNLAEADGHITDTTDADGNVTSTVDGRKGDVGLQVTTTTDADGEEIGDATYGLNLYDADPEILGNFQDLNGLPDVAPVDGATRFEFTEDQLSEIQDQAVDQTLKLYEDNGYPVPSKEELLEQAAGNVYDAPGIDPFTREVLAAESPEEILLAIYASGNGDADAVLNSLNRFAVGTSLARDGDDVPATLSEDSAFPATQVTPDCG